MEIKLMVFLVLIIPLAINALIKFKTGKNIFQQLKRPIVNKKTLILFIGIIAAGLITLGVVNYFSNKSNPVKVNKKIVTNKPDKTNENKASSSEDTTGLWHQIIKVSKKLNQPDFPENPEEYEEGKDEVLKKDKEKRWIEIIHGEQYCFHWRTF